MLGVIIGDIIGSVYEFANTKNFPLFSQGCSFTDDTICTVAIADAILRGVPYRDSLLSWCRRYPHPMGSYGGSFSRLPARGVFDETCQGCVPLAFKICAEASSFTDALRRAVSYGGDSDTLAAIVGSLAEARWGIEPGVRAHALRYLPEDMLSVVVKFENRFKA